MIDLEGAGFSTVTWIELWPSAQAAARETGILHPHAEAAVRDARPDPGTRPGSTDAAGGPAACSADTEPTCRTGARSRRAEPSPAATTRTSRCPFPNATHGSSGPGPHTADRPRADASDRPHADASDRPRADASDCSRTDASDRARASAPPSGPRT
jgi:hypothetical protein